MSPVAQWYTRKLFPPIHNRSTHKKRLHVRTDRPLNCYFWESCLSGFQLNPDGTQGLYWILVLYQTHTNNHLVLCHELTNLIINLFSNFKKHCGINSAQLWHRTFLSLRGPSTINIARALQIDPGDVKCAHPGHLTWSKMICLKKIWFKFAPGAE